MDALRPSRRRTPTPRLAQTALVLAALAACQDREPTAGLAPRRPAFDQAPSGPVVNSLADPGDGACDDTECTLREAIVLAEYGATITFASSLTASGPATITLDQAIGQLVVYNKGALTITGPGSGLLTVKRSATATTDFRVLLLGAGSGFQSINISGLTISGGRSSDGGGIWNSGTPSNGSILTLDDVTVSGNTSTGNGGGISSNSALVVRNSTISGNSVIGSGHGGGIDINDGSGLTTSITNSTISGNSASLGGGVFQYVGAVSLSNVTISGNSAGTGGGYGKEAFQSTTMNHVTIAGNSADNGAGLYSLSGGRPALALSNSIVANNTSGFNCNTSNPSFSDGGGNLVYPAAPACPGITPLTTGDPLLGTLQMNAPGNTATMALGAGSAARDVAPAISCTARDQRGVTRPQGAGCDIGAYEALAVADVTAPVITPTVIGTLGTKGWYTSNVSVSWSVVDDESAISSSSGCGTVTVTADQTMTTYTCTASSAGGSDSKSVTIGRDGTRPVASVTGVSNGATYPISTLPAAGCATTDATSGVGTYASVGLSGLGTVTATCGGGVDNAGNTAAPASVTYTVTASLTVSSQGNGTVTVSPQKDSYVLGEQVTLTATPANGWSFGGWTNALTGTTNPATLTMDANKVVAATFTKGGGGGTGGATTQTLTVTVIGSGTVTSSPAGISCTAGTSPCTASFGKNTNVALTAAPGSGYAFSGWSGDASGAQNPVQVTLSANKTVTATFAPLNGPIVSINASGTLNKMTGAATITGTVSCSGTGTVTIAVTLTQTQTKGRTPTTVSGTGSSAAVACGANTPWTVTITPTSGKFAADAGAATATAGSGSNTATQTVQLK